MKITSKKAFEAALLSLAAGEVDDYGASDHVEVERELRAYNHRASRRDDAFAERAARINEASTQGFANRQTNRAKKIAELEIARARAANSRPW